MDLFFTRFSRWLWLLIICGCMAAPLKAQTRQPSPGSTSSLESLQAKAIDKYLEQAQSNGQQLRKAASGTTFIGIKPWRGAGYWTDDLIIQRINKLNIDFAKSGIQFYIISSGISTITAANSQTLTYPDDETNLLNQNFDVTAINIFFANSVYYCAYPPCVTAEGLSPSLTDLVTLGDRPVNIPTPNVQARKDNYIMIAYVSAFNTLSKQMGHYFGLLGTDTGAIAANCQDRERPIGNRTAGDTDRGDLVDDTDADPYSLYVVNNITPPYNSTNCTYTGAIQHCDPAWPTRNFSPPTNNIMSPWGGGFVVFGNICSDPKLFSTHQLTRMQSFLAPRFNTANQYHLENGVPGIATSPVISVSLTEASIRVTPMDLTITVNNLAGTLGYLLERATDASFTSYQVVDKTSTGGGHTFRNYITSPQQNTTYYFRVRATNGKEYSNVATYTCSPTATLSGSQTVTNGQSATFTVALTGNPPWNVQVGGSTYSNVTSSPLSIVTPPYPALQQTYTQTTSGGSVTNACGTAPLSGTASVTVIGTCPDVPTKILHNDIGCGTPTATGVVLIAGIDYVEGAPVPYTIQWRNVTTGVSYSVTAYPTIVSITGYALYAFLGYTYFGEARNLPAGQYAVDVTDRNGCPATPQTFTIRDYGPNGSTATLSGPANNRIPKGQQTAIRVELTGTAPWSVTYAGRGGRQSVASNITTASYDIPVLADSTTTYRLVAVSGQCSPTALSGTVTLIVVPTLAAYEYFFDTDPGIGTATSLAVGFNQTTSNQSFTVPMPTLSVGVHTLGFRAKDAGGYWSPTVRQPYVVFGNLPTYPKDILYVKYQLDDGPTLDRVSPVNNNEPIAIPISVSLSPGVHVLTTWTYDKRDVQSGYVSRPFVVFGTGSTSSSAITQAEYYVDTDPGVGQATQVAYTAAPGAPFSLSISQGLAPGTHTLLIRTKDGNNRWSVSCVRSFMVAPAQGNISRIEYFFDSSDPGLGTAPTLTFSPANSGTVTATQGITAPLSLSAGTHKLTTRTQTTAGIWSVTKAASFSVTPCFTALALLTGSYTVNAGQAASVSVSFGGSLPWSLTANGQVFTDVNTPLVSFSVPTSSSGVFAINAQTTSLSVSNACGAGVVSGTATITVIGTAPCTAMQTVKAGSWDDPTVWSCGRLPLLTDAVLIRHAVTVPVLFVAHAQKIGFEVGGKLSWGSAARLLLGL